MLYRRLGRTGLRVSLLSLGSWVTFGNQLDPGRARELLGLARERGVNFLDNAESYADGQAERIMGRAIKDLGWDRASLVVSTKLFWGLGGGVNLEQTLNRKYLLQGIDGSLRRLDMDFVDLLFCHRPDPHTTVEEVVWAMSDIVDMGKALYWGTSEWEPSDIELAFEVAEKYRLRKPVVEQPEYSLVRRERVEREYSGLCEVLGIGLLTWSPLASGLLTGKYKRRVPQSSRATLPGMQWLREYVEDPSHHPVLERLQRTAEKLQCTMGQLSIAFCAQNPQVSSVILGASSVEQLNENLDSVSLVPRLTPEVSAALTGPD
ncbi:MAG: aldo/keto reductase [Actinomycetota bacterium]